jgi:hypothetical protein
MGDKIEFEGISGKLMYLFPINEIGGKVVGHIVTGPVHESYVGSNVLYISEDEIRLAKVERK